MKLPFYKLMVQFSLKLKAQDCIMRRPRIKCKYFLFYMQNLSPLLIEWYELGLTSCNCLALKITADLCSPDPTTSQYYGCLSFHLISVLSCSLPLHLICSFVCSNVRPSKAIILWRSSTSFTSSSSTSSCTKSTPTLLCLNEKRKNHQLHCSNACI